MSRWWRPWEGEGGGALAAARAEQGQGPGSAREAVSINDYLFLSWKHMLYILLHPP